MPRVLVIDDEPSVLAAIEQILKHAGHKVVVAANGKEGITQHQREPADLIITDIFMPDHDGIQVITQFRKMAPNVPIIAMSGNPRGGMLSVAEKLGAVAVFEKPFSASDLLRAIDKALNPV